MNGFRPSIARSRPVAMELRVLDMQAGPYDLQAMGFAPVRIETSKGRVAYQRRQRELSERAVVLRASLIDAVSATVIQQAH